MYIREDERDKQKVVDFFTPDIKRDIKDEKIFYHDLVEMFSKSIGGKEVSQHQKSRIYHTAANLISGSTHYKKQTTNKFDIICR